MKKIDQTLANILEDAKEFYPSRGKPWAYRSKKTGDMIHLGPALRRKVKEALDTQA
jgi:hypothetical protein